MQGLAKLADVMLGASFDKAKRLANVYNFGNMAIQEGALDVHVHERPSVLSNQQYDAAHCLPTADKREDFNEINTFKLRVIACN